MKPRVAIIGIGRWGKNLAREFNKVAEITAFCHNENPDNKAWLKKTFPNIPTKNYDNILKDKTTEAVIIATPIKTHYKLTRKALLAGKDVFVEKTITDNIGQAQELVKIAKNKKRVLFVGHIFSYHPILAKLKRLNAVEPFEHADFTWNKLGTFNEEILFNLASHDIATALELFGKPTSIKILENKGAITDSDIINLKLSFKNNTSSTIYINRVSNFKNKSVTFASDKNVYLWENDSLFKLNKKTNSYKPAYGSKKTPLEIEASEFIRCLKQRKKPLTDGEFGLEVVKILTKINTTR
ncbi:MAG: Gfo/Idh/MocA family oxidoreductase [bacterium]|nr:Gfo/Idh/MocA family oxidoreductase [bacterium]